jgi:Ca2+-dependent lipid-binding protein
VTVDSARGLKATKMGGGAPDPYVSLSLGVKPAVARTKTVESTSSPRWQESHYIIVNSLLDSLALTVFDYNEHRSDSRLGTVTHDLSTLMAGKQETLQAKILSEGKDRGDMQYSLTYYPVLEPEVLEDGTPAALPDRKTGIARLTIHQAKDFDMSKHSGTLSSYARLFLGAGSAKQPIFKTSTYKHSNSPAWEAATEFLVTDKTASQISIEVRDDKELAKDALLGQCSIPLSLLLTAKERQQDWYPLKNGGKIRLTLDWKPLDIQGFDTGSAAYVPPIGIMRIWVKKAEDVKNVESGIEGGFNGKSDPYCRVLLFNRVLDRTDFIKNNLNPEWDTIIYAPVHSLEERLTLEVMDYQSITRDRSLGKVDFPVSEYITQSGSDYLSNGSLDKVSPIQLGRGHGVKGRLFYEANFVPCTRLKGRAKFPPISNEPYQPGTALRGNYNLSRKSSVRSTKSSSRPTTVPSFNVSATDIPPPIPETDILKMPSNEQEQGNAVEDSTTDDPDDEDSNEEEADDGVVLTREELLKQGKSGRDANDYPYSYGMGCRLRYPGDANQECSIGS